MFKVSVVENEAAIVLDVEGRLGGPLVEELRECWQRERARSEKPVCIRLSGVTFIDPAGKELLKSMFASGAELEGRGCLIRAILAAITGKFCSGGN